MGKVIDLTGQKYGRLTILQLDRVEKKAYWLCKCDKTQANNRSNTRFITYNGQTKTITDWADTLGINRRTLYSRLFIYKMPPQQAFSTNKYMVGKRG